MPFKAQDSVFAKLEKIVDIASLSKEERMKYDESIKQYRDTIAVMNGQYEEGMAKGMAKGKAEGKSEGERNKALEIAKNLKSMGLPYEQISTVTGLPIDEIKNL